MNPLVADVYCGPAPTPASLWGAWNFDIVALALCAGLVLAWRFSGGGRGWPLAGGIGLLALLFLSPLCALTAALFSARALHHVLLVAVAAPLLASAWPTGRRGRLGLGWIATLHAAVFWVWHVPAVYGAAITDDLGYWAMQFSLLGTGFWFWRRVLDRREHAGVAAAAMLGTIMQMGMLGALLTFAASPLYAPHAGTTMAFGLSALQDQQLAGILMWVPAALPYLAVALARAWPLLAPSGGKATWSG